MNLNREDVIRMRQSYSLAARQCQALVRNPITLSLLVYTAIILALIFPTLGLYMWSGHDQLYPVIRVYEMCKIWRANGPFHAPWVSDWAFGYGYPFFTFYQPFGFYVGALFHFLLGFDYGPATKMSFYSSLYLSGLGMYALVYVIGRREAWPRLPWWALGAATVFSLTRYHLTDLFVRDALGECWAWPTLAGLFLGAEIARQHRGLGIIIIATLYSFLLLSHNITALYGTIAIGCYVLLTSSNIRWPITVMGGGILGSAMAAFFWLPALSLIKLTYASVSAAQPPHVVHLHALYWQQHFVEALGTEGSIPGPNDRMGINLGIAVLIGLTLAAIAFFRPGLSRWQRYRLAVCLTLVGITFFVMSTHMNWARVPALLRFIQFPWRLLIFTAFFGCLATAMASPVLDKWLHPFVWTTIAILMAIPTVPAILNLPGLLTDCGTTDRMLRWYARVGEREGWYAGDNSFWPLSLKPPLRDPKFLSNNPPPQNRIKSLTGELIVEKYDHKGTEYDYQYTAPTDVIAQISVFHFPGWELRIDGRREDDKISMDDKGLVRVKLPAGSHTAELKYTVSPIGRLARYVSYLGWAVWTSLVTILALNAWKKSRRRSPAIAG